MEAEEELDNYMDVSRFMLICLQFQAMGLSDDAG